MAGDLSRLHFIVLVIVRFELDRGAEASVAELVRVVEEEADNGFTSLALTTSLVFDQSGAGCEVFHVFDKSVAIVRLLVAPGSLEAFDAQAAGFGELDIYGPLALFDFVAIERSDMDTDVAEVSGKFSNES